MLELKTLLLVPNADARVFTKLALLTNDVLIRLRRNFELLVLAQNAILLI